MNTHQTEAAPAGFEITRFAKEGGGALSKRIELLPDGTTKSDGSECVMSRGLAERVRIGSITQFADLIGNLASHEAIALGALRQDLPAAVRITTKRRLDELNGSASPDIIARTGGHIGYRPAQPAFALLDFDTKGMPAEVALRIEGLGGFARAVASVVPDIATSARLIRRSTSAGLVRTDTGERLPGSSGVHLYVAVADGTDIERFLKVLHARCWLAGLGWLMVGAGGQLLERSIVDRTVAAPERLVFEGDPILEAPLEQDAAQRRPQAKDGPALDTVAACPDLTILERAEFNRLIGIEAHRLAPERAKARDRFLDAQGEKIAARTNLPLKAARRVAERQTDGVLLPDVVLPFDDPDFAGTTVADILADPARYEGATMADPLEGIAYGPCKAKVMRQSDGQPWIHSFAHGRTTYELRHDARAIDAAIANAPSADVADVFVGMAVSGDLDSEETDRLLADVANRSGSGKRAISSKLKSAKADKAARDRKERWQQDQAMRRDSRPQIHVPLIDEPFIPVMGVLNEALKASRAAEPPMRDAEGHLVQVRTRSIPTMHALSANSTNDGDGDGSRLPPPEQPLITRLGETQVAELIEKHIDFTDPTGRSVHLPTPFVKHYVARDDGVLPIAVAIATLPIVLMNGTILSGKGLIREYGIISRIPPEMLDYVPDARDCDDSAVREALRFLMDEWLCDVATDFTGRCILLALALTLIERSMLPERPAFFVTAGKRGGGKTTAIFMILVAIMGTRPAAAAWSPNEEERRKSLLSYLMDGLPCIVWDNVPRGAQISCPHIERSCTTAIYSDRKLGVSEKVAVAASTVHLFTGNNIAPRGDLASRSLNVRLEVDRADPENRPFEHPDPIGWTEANRGKILRALYTILLGNPVMRGANPTPKTRFKAWWLLVGSALEHAAKLNSKTLDFGSLFLSQEEGDEDGAALYEFLSTLADKWPDPTQGFKAADLAQVANDMSEYRTDEERQRAAIVREFLYPKISPGHIVTSQSLSQRLKRHVGEPVQRGGETLVLRTYEEAGTGGNPTSKYCVQTDA
ncbi:MAG: hypothetical protein AB7Q01_17285 [Gammaproteobacteria bacterium]